jgi:hypothetical protein
MTSRMQHARKTEELLKEACRQLTLALTARFISLRNPKKKSCLVLFGVEALHVER